MTRRRSTSETEIPFCHIPQVIIWQIRTWSQHVFRVRVKRTHVHHDDDMFQTKPISPELLARKDDAPASKEASIDRTDNNPSNKTNDDGCGRVA